MEMQKRTIQTECVVWETTAQTEMDSTIPLPEGRMATQILSCRAEVLERKSTVTEQGILLDGTLLLHVVALEETAPFAFDASADFSHCIRREGLSDKMQVRLLASVPRCRLALENGVVRMQAVVSIAVVVTEERPYPCLICPETSDTLEVQSEPIRLVKRSKTTTHSIRIQETMRCAETETLLCSEGTVSIAPPVVKGDQTMLMGDLTAVLRLVLTDGDVIERAETFAFSDILTTEGEEHPYATARILAWKVVRGEEGLILDAIVSVQLGSVTETTVLGIIDAYDETHRYHCSIEEVRNLEACGTETVTVPFRETVPLSEDAPNVALPLFATGTAAVTALFYDEDGVTVEGCLLLDCIYRGDDGRLHSERTDLPISVTVPKQMSIALAFARPNRLTLLGGGRQLRIEGSVTVELEGSRETVLRLSTDCTEGEPVEPLDGIVLLFGEEQDTLFSVGKRFGIPSERVRAWNPGVSETVSEAGPILLLPTR